MFSNPPQGSAWLELLGFFFLICASDWFPVSLPGTITEITMTMPAVLGLFIIHGVWATILVSAPAFFTSSIATHRRGWPIRTLISHTAFNTASITVCIATGSLAYMLAGGLPFSAGMNITYADVILPLMIWVFVTSSTDTILVATAGSLYMGEPWRMHAVPRIRWMIPNLLVTWPAGVLFAYLYDVYGIQGIILMIVPFMVGRKALDQYSKQMSAYRETITTLGVYMQHYHPYTKGHLERVANLADKIAKQMGLAMRSLEFMKDAGLLHDIGKVGVDEGILDKVGQLTDEDWAIIKQHPARGAEILAQMKYLEPIVPWVRGHHERPDGKGYPDGLKDGAIPLEAAVLAVADAFDAMTGGPDEKDRRVYRTPLTLDQAIDQLRYGAGTQFDPRVVKAFMQVMAKQEAEGGN